MTRKVMKLLDSLTGLMECKVCGATHYANLQSGVDRADGVTRYYRGSWQCENGCKLEDNDSQREIIITSSYKSQNSHNKKH